MKEVFPILFMNEEKSVVFIPVLNRKTKFEMLNKIGEFNSYYDDQIRKQIDRTTKSNFVHVFSRQGNSYYYKKKGDLASDPYRCIGMYKINETNNFSIINGRFKANSGIDITRDKDSEDLEFHPYTDLPDNFGTMRPVVLK